MAAYAYVCQGCWHLSSNHTQAEGGLYRCAHCSCEITQGCPVAGLNRREYEAYEARSDTPRNIWLDLIP